MSRALDNLTNAVNTTVKSAAGTTITKENLIDLIDQNLGYLYNVSAFFTALGANSQQLQDWINTNRRALNLKSIQIFNKIDAGLVGSAKLAMNDRFLGGFSDTTNALIIILEEISGNLDKFFAEKTITVYNTKISQVAVFGMIDNVKTFTEYVNRFISILMADRNQNLDKPEKYVTDYVDTNTDVVVALMNRVINQKLSKTFSAAILKYRTGGSDITVVNSENKPTVQFAKINTEVTESDIASGARGIAIFRWWGNHRVDIADKKNRKRVAEREQLQARARLLQLELDGLDPNSPEYQRLVKIIANYQKQIDRLNQDIEKYENS